MKKIINIAEKVLLALFIIGFILKYIIHLSGGSESISVSLFLLSMLYLRGGYYLFSDETIKKQNKLMLMISGLPLSIMVIGILFKLQFWPSSKTMLLVGVISGTISTLILLFIKIKIPAELKIYCNRILVRITFFLSLSTILYLTPSTALIKLKYSDKPELGRLKIQCYENPDNAEFQKQLDDAWTKDSLNNAN